MSSDPFVTATAAAEREAAARFTRWDAGRFADVAAGPASAVWSTTKSAPVLAAYLRLSAEAIGQGHLDSQFFVRCWLELVPPALAGERKPLELLARTWNLCEGVASQPLWLQRLVFAAAASSLSTLSELEPFLVSTLTPLLGAGTSARFSGPFAVSHLDLRAFDDHFLPGDMHCVGAAVLCVHDRFRRDVHLALLLGRGGSSRVLGSVPCLGTDQAQLSPAHEVGPHHARLAEHRIELPLLARPHASVVAPAGFVAVSAVDSQRLWVAESA